MYVCAQKIRKYLFYNRYINLFCVSQMQSFFQYSITTIILNHTATKQKDMRVEVLRGGVLQKVIEN